MPRPERKPQTARGVVVLSQKLRLLLAGGAAGLTCGLFGAGGGMLLVPLLVHLCHLESRTAFASALSIMLPISVVSLLVYHLSGGLPLRASLPYLAGGALGGLLAGLCYKRIPTRFLHRAMGLLILWGGLRLLWK